ncbi:MAG: hypothetical protein IPM50_14440 [Acidobacteriota bacterium]|nr:MAG: hypothetical protein IPM50_14440 [Acidobacteriota bacterium]
MLGYRALFLTLFVLASAVAAQAQIFPTPTPTPRPGSRQANLPPTVADNEHYDRLRKIEMMGQPNSLKDHPLLDPNKGIYRKPSKEETAILTVSEVHLNKYAAFLRGQNTGIVKLNGESSCVTDADVIVASEQCVNFKMPGSGTAFSFRTETYRLPRLADIIVVEGIFMTGGVFQQVIMTELGDVELDTVTLSSPTAKHLVEMKTVRDSDDFMRFNEELIKGYDANGFRYAKGWPVKKNAVYLLRSIAYRGQFLRTIEGVQYDELGFDKRRDMIVAFRVVDVDDAGHVTIVWKRLKDNEAPKLKIAK